jgi:hypothetical protein
VAFSPSTVRSGNYSGVYFGQLPSGVSDCRVVATETLAVNLTGFHEEVWVYVPTQTQTGWVSFHIRLQLKQQFALYHRCGPIGIDTHDHNSHKSIHLCLFPGLVSLR